MIEWLLVLAVLGGLYMAWNIGANDVANAMGTSVGSKALTLKQAILVAAIFEFAGAVLVGTHVTDTVRRGIVETTLFETTGPLGAEGPLLLAVGMFGALLAAGIWLHIATMFALPVSTTHSIIGAVVGFAVAALGVEAVQWGVVWAIAASWVLSPVAGGMLAWTTFIFIQRSILARSDPIAAVRRIAPFLVAGVAFILALSFIFKALSNVLRDPAPGLSWAVAGGIAFGAYWLTRWLIGTKPVTTDDPYAYVEKVFRWLQIVTASYVAFAHGANDVANAIGPLAAVVTIVGSEFQELPHQVPVPMWVLVLGAAGIVIGLATYGWKVIKTIGSKITELTPSRGFSAEFGAATTVLVASRIGMPVSTTHTLVGAVIGVGLARGMAALDLRTIGKIVNSWIATLPAAGLLSAVLFLILRAVFV